MGQHKRTAFACSDWNLAKRDLLDDLMAGWDCCADMANGASEADRSNAKEALNALSQEWDCLDMPEDALEEFADEYDATLRTTARNNTTII